MLYSIIALICSLIWAGVMIAIHLLTGHISPFAFAFLRYSFVVISLLPFIIVRREYRKLQRADIPGFIFLGVSLVLVFNALFFNALAYASPNSVALIGSANPIFMMFIAAMLSLFTPNRSQLIAFVLALIGVTVMVTKGKIGAFSFTKNIGELFTVAAVLCQTFYAFGLRKVSVHNSTLMVTFGTALLGILCVVPFIVNREFFDTVSQLSAFHWGLLAFIGIGGSTIAIFLYALAMKHLGAARISLIVFGSMPIFVIMLSYVVLAEGVTMWQLTGGSLVLGSLVIGLS